MSSLSRCCRGLHLLASNSLLLIGEWHTIEQESSAVEVTALYTVIESIRERGYLYSYTVYDERGTPLYSVREELMNCPLLENEAPLKQWIEESDFSSVLA